MTLDFIKAKILFYLLKGYNVVAVDADIELIEEGKSSLKSILITAGLSCLIMR